MNVFLVPASPNAGLSLGQPIDRMAVRAALRNEQKYSALIREIGKWDKIYCWPARGSKRTAFSRMTKGDLVLFAVKDTGRFNYMGRIVAKLESDRFARIFWQDKTLIDWTLIYFLRDVEHIAVNKPMMAALLGNNKNDRFQTLRTVPPARLERFASIEEFIRVLNAITAGDQTAPVVPAV
jgi:hypothetical protein